MVLFNSSHFCSAKSLNVYSEILLKAEISIFRIISEQIKALLVFIFTKIVRTVYSILDVFGFYLLYVFRCNNHWMHMNLYQLYLLYSWFILQGKLSFYFLNYCIVILHMHVELFNLKVNNRFGLLKHIFATWLNFENILFPSDICLWHML